MWNTGYRLHQCTSVRTQHNRLARILGGRGTAHDSTLRACTAVSRDNTDSRVQQSSKNCLCVCVSVHGERLITLDRERATRIASRIELLVGKPLQAPSLPQGSGNRYIHKHSTRESKNTDSKHHNIRAAFLPGRRPRVLAAYRRALV